MSHAEDHEMSEWMDNCDGCGDLKPESALWEGSDGFYCRLCFRTREMFGVVE